MMKAVSGSVFESHEADAGKITQRRRYSSTGRGGDVNSVLTTHRIEEEGNLIVIGQGSIPPRERLSVYKDRHP
jgi:hypothetical protein